MSWMYDGWGNRLQQSAVKGSVPTMVSITDPATNRIQAHTYDANGNTVNTPQQGAMTYDVLNRLKTVASDVYGYNPGNTRIWKNDEFTFWGAGGERIGRYSAVKLVNDGGAHVFVFQKVQVDEYFGGRRLTSEDQLGSVGSYYPYGEAKSGTVSNADSFATYYRDSTALDYAQQRYYVVGSGRFLTPDPLGSSLNLYSYADTDPVNGNDPEGLLTVIVSGTSEQNATWSQPGSPMFNAIRDQFGETDGCVVVFDWSTSVAGTASGDAMRATGWPSITLSTTRWNVVLTSLSILWVTVMVGT